jgi:hypothetical protein
MLKGWAKVLMRCQATLNDLPAKRVPSAHFRIGTRMRPLPRPRRTGGTSSRSSGGNRLSSRVRRFLSALPEGMGIGVSGAVLIPDVLGHDLPGWQGVVL